VPFTAARFAKIRPYLFHLTDRDNLDAICSARVLRSAASLMRQAGDESFLRRKRRESLPIVIGGATIRIRDQQPLHSGNIRFDSEWTLERVIESLNERVFFWPGTGHGPISYGVRHFERYAHERPVILRVQTPSLFAENPDATPLYSCVNSGSPRCSKGLGSARGPRTFVACADAGFTPSKVVEVTFANEIALPAIIEIADSILGPWRRVARP
jgi:hypothetical protein